MAEVPKVEQNHDRPLYSALATAHKRGRGGNARVLQSAHAADPLSCSTTRAGPPHFGGTELLVYLDFLRNYRDAFRTLSHQHFAQPGSSSRTSHRFLSQRSRSLQVVFQIPMLSE